MGDVALVGDALGALRGRDVLLAPLWLLVLCLLEPPHPATATDIAAVATTAASLFPHPQRTGR